MSSEQDEEQRLHSVVERNSETTFHARQRTDRDLLDAKAALEARSTELAAAHALSRATLEATADGILVTSQTGIVTGFNAQCLSMWRIPLDIIDSADHGRLLDVMAAQVREGTAFLAGVRRIVQESPGESFDMVHLADGRVFERHSRAQKVGNSVIGRVWCFRDVTLRTRSETALLQAKTEAEAAERAKNVFLAMMSHELRTPLNAIAGYAQLIDMGVQGPVTPDQRSSLARIQWSQQHLLALIDEVLIHAKLETDSLTFDLAPVRLMDTIAGAESLLAPQATAKGIILESEDCDAHIHVFADAEKLQRLLTNLLSNAVKFTRPGGHVEIVVVCEEDVVKIDVRDNGPGIPRSMLQEIFKPFVQVRSDLSRTDEGTGLGLAISRALATGMAGHLDVDSTPGIGSTFTLRLPAVSP